jgi:hypothetical protein
MISSQAILATEPWKVRLRPPNFYHRVVNPSLFLL